MSDQPTDLLGRPVNAEEAELLELYGRIKALASAEGLAPCVEKNLRFAVCALAQAVTDLGLAFEHF